MFFYQGLTCPVCNNPFHEGEDIVSCPQCGLPHHRLCWNKETHCHLEHLHGTEEQWSREKAQHSAPSPAPDDKATSAGRVCPRCGNANLEYAEFCTRCGNALSPAEWRTESETHPPVYGEYSPFHTPFQTYAQDEQIGDHTAADLAAVVGANSLYYLPRFRKIAATGNGGWNWSAFIFGPYWLLYRKNYGLGLLLFIVQSVYTLASNAILAPIQMATTPEAMQAAIDQLLADDLTRWMLLPMMVISAILLVAGILLGLHGNRLYMHDCCKRIDRAKKQEGGCSTAELSNQGGVSLTSVVVAHLVLYAVTYVLMLIQAL